MSDDLAEYGFNKRRRGIYWDDENYENDAKRYKDSSTKWRAETGAYNNPWPNGLNGLGSTQPNGMIIQYGNKNWRKNYRMKLPKNTNSMKMNYKKKKYGYKRYGQSNVRRWNINAYSNTGKEVKTFDARGYLPVCTTTQIALLNGMKTGTGYWNRIGSKVNLLSMQLRGAITWNNSMGSTACNEDFLRWAIVYDRQPNGTTPVWTDIFKGFDPVAQTAIDDAFENINPENRDRFIIIRDKCVYIPPAGAGAAVSNTLTQYVDPSGSMCLDFYAKLGGLETKYNNGTAGTVGDITTGALWIVSRSNVALAGTTAHFNLQYAARLTIRDQ
jgi:hypothetical protein